MCKAGSYKILIVDDISENIALLSEILSQEGYQVSAAKEGKTAIKIAQHILPDLILLDIMMPEMDGFEVCQRLKSDIMTQDIPVIFISAKTGMADLAMAFSVGAVDYINTPFYAEEIKLRIDNQLKTTRLHQKLILSELNMRNLLSKYQFQSERLQQVIDHVVDGIVEINLSGEIQLTNPAVETLFSYNAAELSSMAFSQLLAHPFDYQCQQFFSTKKTNDDEIFFMDKVSQIIAKKKNGQEFPIDLFFVKISMEKEVYLAVIHDISIHKESEEKLRSLSNTDQLTGLANRRYFESMFEQQWPDICRDNKQIAFIMIDIDYFKAFNDIYGHDAGDNCLTQVAHSLNNNIKCSNDLVARIGGEEFAIILLDTEIEEVLKVTEQLRKSVVMLKIAHSGSKHKYVTVSLGVAISYMDVSHYSYKTLYQLSDKALYTAKASGRNQYFIDL